MAQYSEWNRWLAQRIQQLNWLDQTLLQRTFEWSEAQNVSLLTALSQHNILSPTQVSQLDSEMRSQQGQQSQQRQIGGYSLLAELGRGAAGLVYKVEKNQQIYALKVLVNSDGGQLQRFLSEAEALKKLDHPNLMRVHDSGVDEATNKPYMVMDFVDGQSLDRVLSDRGYLSEELALKILRDVAVGLEHAHSQDLLHRDIKPANILVSMESDVSGDGRAVLTDFGLAKFTESQLESLTRTGEMLGTPAYMSPEQIGGDRHKVDHRSDIYSLGASFYELVTGQRLYHANSMIELVALIIANRWESPRKLRPVLSARVEMICQRCLNKDPEKRYANVSELIADIDRELESRGGKWVRLALGAGIVLACLILLFVLLNTGQIGELSGSGLNVQIKTEPRPVSLQFMNLKSKQSITFKPGEPTKIRKGRYLVSCPDPGWEVPLSQQKITISRDIPEIVFKLNEVTAIVDFTASKNITADLSDLKTGAQTKIPPGQTAKIPPGNYQIQYSGPGSVTSKVQFTFNAHDNISLIPRPGGIDRGLASSSIVLKERRFIGDSDNDGCDELVYLSADSAPFSYDLDGLGIDLSRRIVVTQLLGKGKFTRILGQVPEPERVGEFLAVVGPAGWQLTGPRSTKLLRLKPPVGVTLNQDLNSDGIDDLAFVDEKFKLRVWLSGQPNCEYTSRFPVDGKPMTICAMKLRDNKSYGIIILTDNDRFRVYRTDGTRLFATDAQGMIHITAGDFVKSNPGDELLAAYYKVGNTEIEIADSTLKQLRLVRVPGKLAHLSPITEKIDAAPALAIANDEGQLWISHFEPEPATLREITIPAPVQGFAILDKTPAKLPCLLVNMGKALAVYQGGKFIDQFELRDAIEWIEPIDVNLDGYTDFICQSNKGVVSCSCLWNQSLEFFLDTARVPGEIIYGSQQAPQFGNFICFSPLEVVNTATGVHLTHESIDLAAVQVPPWFDVDEKQRIVWFSAGTKVFKQNLVGSTNNEPKLIIEHSRQVVQHSRLASGALIFGDDSGRLTKHSKLNKHMNAPDWSIELNGKSRARWLWSRDATRLITVTDQGVAYLVDVATGEVIHELALPGPVQFHPIALEAGERWFLVTQSGNCGFLTLHADILNFERSRTIYGQPIAQPIGLRDETRQVYAFAIAFREGVCVLKADGKNPLFHVDSNPGSPWGGVAPFDLDGNGVDELAVLPWRKESVHKSYVNGAVQVYDQSGRKCANLIGQSLVGRLSHRVNARNMSDKIWVTGMQIAGFHGFEHKPAAAFTPAPSLRRFWSYYVLGLYELFPELNPLSSEQDKLELEFLRMLIKIEQTGDKTLFDQFQTKYPEQTKRFLAHCSVRIKVAPEVIGRMAMLPEEHLSIPKKNKVVDKAFTRLKAEKATSPDSIVEVNFSGLSLGYFRTLPFSLFLDAKHSGNPSLVRIDGFSSLKLEPDMPLKLKFYTQKNRFLKLDLQGFIKYYNRGIGFGRLFVQFDKKQYNICLNNYSLEEMSTIDLGEIPGGMHTLFLRTASTNTTFASLKRLRIRSVSKSDSGTMRSQ